MPLPLMPLQYQGLHEWRDREPEVCCLSCLSCRLVLGLHLPSPPQVPSLEALLRLLSFRNSLKGLAGLLDALGHPQESAQGCVMASSGVNLGPVPPS